MKQQRLTVEYVRQRHHTPEMITDNRVPCALDCFKNRKNATRGTGKIATWGAIEIATWGAVKNATWGAERDATWGAVKNATWGAERDAAWGALVASHVDRW